MRQEINPEGMVVIIDPCSKNENPARAVAQSCGLLPQWFDLYIKNPNKSLVPVKDWMEECYRMGNLFEMQQGTGQSTIHPDHTMTYPGDPTLYPLIYMKDKEVGAEMIQWDMGIVAFRDKPEDPWFLTRMD